MRVPSCSQVKWRRRAPSSAPYSVTASSQSGIAKARPREISAQRRAVGRRGKGFEQIAGLDEPARALRCRRGSLQFDAPDAVVGRIEDHDLGTAGVDDPAAVGRWKAGVILALVGMTAQIGAVGRAGIDVADAFVIGKEEDARTDPHRPHEIAGDVAAQPGRMSPLPVRVDPKLPGRSAAVALPARGVDGVASDEHRAAGGDRE